MTGEILIVENEPFVIKELTSVLEEANFEVSSVPDIPDALHKLADFEPELVIMETALPSGDGIGACYQIRRRLNVPIILIGNEEPSPELWGRLAEATADLYLQKPLRYWELIARLKAILRRCRMQKAGPN